jgi:hypothetical protein
MVNAAIASFQPKMRGHARDNSRKESISYDLEKFRGGASVSNRTHAPIDAGRNLRAHTGAGTDKRRGG